MKKFLNRPVVKFILLTFFYFVIIMALVYLYSYAGINNSKFIYNEF
ncbi:teichoic acid D-Ala incorporation-associated protein DltX [Bombilactobacillus mellifer]